VRPGLGGRQPQFPNAQIYISQADLEFWTDDKRLGTPPAEGSALAARKNLIPNRERIVFYKDGQEVLPGVQAMHTPGRTVGHTSFVVNSGGKSLFVVGDLMHHVILVEKPRMEVGFDTDLKQGIETRIKVMDMLAAQRMPALVYHLPWPGIGHFAKQGDGFRYVAEPMRLVL
jgi:glyoxylase-like metal-dependent hydrolase (beta-lactamase superfamily II)